MTQPRTAARKGLAWWPAGNVAGTVALLAALLVATPAGAADDRRSGRQFMSPAVQALQQDDAQNPAMLWVQDGEQLWRTPAAASASRGALACA